AQWIPESFLEQGYTDLDMFFGGLESLRDVRGMSQEVRSFCKNLKQFYQSTPDGERHLELLVLDRRRNQEKTKFQVASEGSLFRTGAEKGGAPVTSTTTSTKLPTATVIPTTTSSTASTAIPLPTSTVTPLVAGHVLTGRSLASPVKGPAKLAAQESGQAKLAAQESGQAKIDNITNSPKPSTSAATSSTGKHKKDVCTTLEPWRSLMIALMDIVNGKNVASFPERVPGMNREHALLFDHAVTSLEQYQDQDVKDKNVVLVKDAQVAMSCVFNTMSERACRHFEKFQENELVKSAKVSSLIEGFEQHECLTTLKKYAPILAGSTVQKFKAKLIIDRGAIFSKYWDQERLPASVEVEDKVLQILIIICQLIIRPPFGNESPSESDCLHVWLSVFSVMVDKLTIHTGEKVLESSKIMRQQQSAEYGDVSESGRKVDMLFMFDGVEVSNVEFKRPGTTEQDLAIQNRKNVRLARCIQEAHAALGVTDPSVLMADVAGFVGTIYQVKPLNEIAVAGETADTTVSLPRTRATLMAFLGDHSLAMMWNYVSRLEVQGQSVSEAKELHDLALEKAKLERAKRGRGQSSPDSPPAMIQKRFQDNVTLTPTKKR
ncbi:hypothetical protein BGW38_006065, partial [Lunasporangiospora selenospora]